MPFRRGLQLLIILTALLSLLGCRSLIAGQAEPPRPTIVPAEPTATPSPTPVPTEPPPTATAALAPSNTPVELAQTDTPTATPSPTELPPPTDTPTTVPQPTEPPPTATLAPTEPPSDLPLESIQLNLIPIASGFTKPLFVTHAGDGSGRLFVVEQPGRIFIVKDGTVNPNPFLDIETLVGSEGFEQGLLSVAFHPDYSNNGFFFVDYTNKQGDTVITRYQVSGNPDIADPNSAKVLLIISQPYVNHNGGQLVFGPDGYLYVGMGDGGSAGDPHNNGQSLNTLLGKILRLDVNQGDPYGVPDSNPFVNQADARPEIWSYGWRNPWRFSFDKATGDMYIADVGQDEYEEVDVELAGTPGGQNYGWRLMEGLHCFNPSDCNPGSLNVVLPVTEYDHSQGCSVTGGYVYRGSRFPALTGIYFYGDFCSGKVWGLRRAADGSWSNTKLLESGLSITSFGQDAAGEVYLVDQGGTISLIGN